MPLEVVLHPKFDPDYLALPFPVQDEADRVIAALRRRPFAPGVGYSVEQLGGDFDPGVRVAHFLENQFRLLFWVYGNHLILVAVGRRPGFYRSLDRLRGRP